MSERGAATVVSGEGPTDDRVPDPITVEIIRNSFLAIAEEMNTSLIRSAYSWIIYEAVDCSVALIDADKRVLGHSSGLPIFLGNLEACLEITEELLGADCWEPGDVWVLNDSEIGGTHLNDITVMSPIFFDDELAAFVVSRAHHMDVGAKDPGGTTDSTDIFQEGMRLGPTKLVAGGERREDVIATLARNSRLPYQLLGDLGAQIAISKIGEQRLEELFEKYGRAVVEAARDEIYAQAERQDREAVAAIPDGTYRTEGCLDSDGVGGPGPWVRVRIDVEGDRMVIDLTESDDEARGPVNCGATQAVSACRLAFKRLANPDDPVNGGSFAPLEIKLREGSILAARAPAACWWYFSCLGLFIDLVGQALADVLPDRVAGAHYGDSSIFIMSGTDPRSEQPFVDLQAHAGGWGAWRGSDGENGVINAVNSQVKDFPIEVVETKVPLRITRYGFRADSGGRGQWRGGNGLVREYLIECDDFLFTAWFERSVTPAWGLAGGEAAQAPRVTINPGREDEQTLLKASVMPLKRGDLVRAETGGGGGYGDPAERDSEAVAADLAAGLVTSAGTR